MMLRVGPGPLVDAAVDRVVAGGAREGGALSKPSRGPQGGGEAPRRRVRRLPDALVDQIAAGEVVERPASVAKELVENALDAGARRVRVEVRDGGAALVAVTDDGSGMGPEDARLALERHATSKLASAEDLGRLASFGFRGEALPAIASVSRLRLRSRPRGAATGVELRVDHGRLVEEREAAGPEGTRVEVADLFAGIPARRKFLKSAATEWGHVADWLSRAALALPEVHFDVARDDRPALAWPAARDPLERIAAVLSEREAESLVPASGEEGALRLRAFVSRPDAHRATAAGVHLFVNERPVRDRLLRHALLEVYRDWLPRGRFPTALLFLELPAEAVDVNVHPAKWEVRFADPQAVHRLVRRSLRDAVGQRGWLGGQGAAPGPAPARGFAESGGSAGAPWPRQGGPAPAPSEGPPGDWRLAAAHEERAAAPLLADAEPEPALRFGDLRCVGQLLGTYLLVETKQGLLLVDQHAAHERVLYERLRAAWLEGGAPRQPLLLPVTLELDAVRVAALARDPEATARLGFEVEPFGETAAVVRAVPALLAEYDPARLVRNLADELATASPGDAAEASAVRRLEVADHLFATMACHAARRGGDVLEADEQRALLDSLDSIPWAPTCPHGRPVAVPVTLAEIERRFGR